MIRSPLAIRIRQLANNKKLTIAKLGKIAGLQNNAVRDILIGKSKNPTLSTLTKICNALDCSFDDLLNEGEFSQKHVLPVEPNVYSNKEWDYELFTKCTQTVEKYLNKYEISFSLSKIIVLVIDLYLYSSTKNDNQLDEKSAEWLIEKLKVNIPIKLQVMTNSLGAKIRQLATNKILPIAKLEKIAGLQNGVVRDIIIGKSKNPTLNTLTKICNALECSVYDLLDSEEIFHKYILSTRIESYIDAEWNYPLFIKCVEMVGKYLNKHGSGFALSKAISLIRDLYLWLLFENDNQVLDDSFDEKLLEKLNLTIEKRIIFDKNFVQGLGTKELEKYNRSPYIPFITIGLQFELLGDLVKEGKKYEKQLKERTKEQYTTEHFKKIQHFPLARYGHMDLVNMELFDGQTIKIRHNLFDFKLNSSPNINAIDIFDHPTSKRQINRWISGKFIEKDKILAKKYRDGRITKRKELLESISGELSLNLDLDLEKIINFIDSPLSPGNRLANQMLWYLEKIITDKFTKKIEQNKQRSILIEKMKGKSLAEVAPYTAYVFAIDAFFHLNFLLKKENRKPNEPDSDWIDFNYLYYFPFIDIFATKDEGLKTTINNLEFNSYITVIPTTKS